MGSRYKVTLLGEWDDVRNIKISLLCKWFSFCHFCVTIHTYIHSRNPTYQYHCLLYFLVGTPSPSLILTINIIYDTLSLNKTAEENDWLSKNNDLPRMRMNQGVFYINSFAADYCSVLLWFPIEEYHFD